MCVRNAYSKLTMLHPVSYKALPIFNASPSTSLALLASHFPLIQQHSLVRRLSTSTNNNNISKRYTYGKTLSRSSNLRGGKKAGPAKLEHLFRAQQFIESAIPRFFTPEFFVSFFNTSNFDRSVTVCVERVHSQSSNASTSSSSSSTSSYLSLYRCHPGFMRCFFALRFIRAYYSWHFSFRQPIITSLHICEEEATIDTTVRVRCLSSEVQSGANLLKSNNDSDKDTKRVQEMLDDLIERKAIWHDFRVVFSITDETKIRRILVTEVNRPDPNSTNQRRLTGLAALREMLLSQTRERLGNKLPKPVASKALRFDSPLYSSPGCLSSSDCCAISSSSPPPSTISLSPTNFIPSSTTISSQNHTRFLHC